MTLGIRPNHDAAGNTSAAPSEEHPIAGHAPQESASATGASSYNNPAEVSSFIHDQYVSIPQDASNSAKRPREDDTEEGSAKRPKLEENKNGLAAIAQLKDKSAFYGALNVPDVASLNRTSKQWNQSVQSESVLPQLHGRKTVSDPNDPSQKQDLWSKEPSTEPKRYFKPTSGSGAVDDVPHMSQQDGHPTHLTDVGSKQFDAHSGRPAGEYPTKMQFHQEPNNTLGMADVPARSQGKKGRVLTPAPSQAGEKPDTYIETKSYNKAQKGPLPPSYPRTHLTPEQAATPVADTKAKWEGKTVTSSERPTKK